MIVFSHGGLNAAPIEAAMYAKERGLKVIAITSGENYQKATATHSSGNKLGDVADILIDNCCPLEDALVAIPGYHQKVGASSTVAVITIAQSIASETALRLEKLATRCTFLSPPTSLKFLKSICMRCTRTTVAWCLTTPTCDMPAP